MNDWEATFCRWAGPPSQTEQEKCANALRMIRAVIEADQSLRARQVSVFVQGSYRSNTNVRLDSDVDICVLSRATLFYELPEGTEASKFGLQNPATYQFPQFRADVERALVSGLGRDSVTRGKKAFDVHANTYRVDSDVIACFEHRRYRADGSYLEGAEFVTDGGERIINWPEQSYQNGVQKNHATSRRFKAVVRILKSLRNAMADAGIAAASNAPSFLLESLVWNIPNAEFGRPCLSDDVRNALTHLYHCTLADAPCAEWGEVNELKYLFRPAQRWTRADANSFILAAWQYVGFK